MSKEGYSGADDDAFLPIQDKLDNERENRNEETLESLQKLDAQQIQRANAVIKILHPLSDIKLSEAIPQIGWLLKKCGCKTRQLDTAFSRVKNFSAADSTVVDDMENEDKDGDYDQDRDERMDEAEAIQTSINAIVDNIGADA